MSDKADKTCPQCKGKIKDATTGCDKCEIYQCTECGEWVVWDLGGEDDEGPLCDPCWDGKHDDTADEELKP